MALNEEDLLGQLSKPVTKKLIKKLDLLETIICWLNLLSDGRYALQPIDFSIDILDLIRAGNISIEDRTILLNISSKDRRQIKRKVLYTGGVTINEVMRILLVDERVATLVLENLNYRKIDKEWFSFKDLGEDKDNGKIPLRLAGSKMLAVTPELEISSFYDGLRRHASRFYTSIAPIEVFRVCMQNIE